MVQQLLDEHEEKMKKTLEDLRESMSSVRTGKASPSLLNNIRVDYYGSQVPISGAAGISVPEPRMIVIQPWDKSMLAVIEKEIMKSDLGITPTNDGTVIRLAIPELTEERRKDMAKLIRKYGEEHKVAVRNIRRDANDHLKKMLKNHDISEDNEHDALLDVQEVTDKYIKLIDEALDRKEVEIMEV